MHNGVTLCAWAVRFVSNASQGGGACRAGSAGPGGVVAPHQACYGDEQEECEPQGDESGPLKVKVDVEDGATSPGWPQGVCGHDCCDHDA